MAFLKIAFAVGVFLCLATLLDCTSAKKQHHDHEMKRRAVGPEQGNKKEQQQQQQEKKTDPAWTPDTRPREFTVNVQDNIHGANQHRHEKWNNGTVTGSYAAPGRNGKWLKYEYIADDKGFRIVSTKEVSPAEFQGTNPAKDHEATVSVNQDQAAPIKYTLTEEPLTKSKDKGAKDKLQQAQ